MRLRFSALLILALVVLTGCRHEGKSDASSEPKAKVEPEIQRIPVPKFDRDTAFAYVAKQVSFGPRVPGSDAHKACRDFLVSELRRFGLETTVQSMTKSRYDGVSMTGYNIIGQYRPDLPDRVLLAAHWDSRFQADQDMDASVQDQPIDGANDGASGVGVLLEIARQLSENPVDQGVDIIFFDLEDQGQDTGDNPESWALGAQHWSRNTHIPAGSFAYGILLDMVGAENARFGKEYYSMQFAPEIVNKVWRRARSMGYNQYFLNQRMNGVTDDHYYVNTIAKIPMIDIIDYNNTRGFFEHWHTQADNLDAIDPKTLGAVGQVVLAVVYKTAEGSFLN